MAISLNTGNNPAIIQYTGLNSVGTAVTNADVKGVELNNSSIWAKPYTITGPTYANSSLYSYISSYTVSRSSTLEPTATGTTYVLGQNLQSSGGVDPHSIYYGDTLSLSITPTTGHYVLDDIPLEINASTSYMKLISFLL